MIFNETEQQERAYLQQIIYTLKKTINQTDVSVKEHVDTLQEYKDYLWSNKDIDPHEIRSMRESILNHFALGENVIDKRRRLDRILDTPYFGRIDFRNIPLYIGIHTFYDTTAKMNLIYDWRAPVSSMYYDYELGEASFLSPAGEVKGNISLKRQYRIRKGYMEYMLESSVTIHDDILQKELSNSSDDKMRTIVATIQYEQNRIIRNEEAPVLIIQGVAGSGKTSIALHRIAYLLYTLKGELDLKDILIISPNKVFADYISNVLPELGEEMVSETSMEQVLSRTLDNKYKYQTFFEQVTELLSDPTPGFIDRIQYKASFDFIKKLDKFLLHVENTGFRATHVKLNKYITIPAEFLEEQFRRFNRYPVRQRFEVMADYILEMMKLRYRVTATTAERNLLKKEIKNMFVGNSDIGLYKDFFTWMGRPELFKLRKNRTIEYADLAPLAYLRIALEGSKSQPDVKHLLIDEMQDYSPVQYKVIQKLYPCKKTVLGDAAQSVNPYGSSTADMIRKVFVTGKVMKLCKSYRSTYEITSFAQKIRPNPELETIVRHGEPPRILKFGSEEKEIKGILELLRIFKESSYTSLGIICKSESQAEAITGKLKGYIDDIYFLSSRSCAFVQGIIVTSAHMAKGLEFDEVIIPLADSKNYHSEMDCSILYIGVTRAMHRLTVTYSNTSSPLLPPG